MGITGVMHVTQNLATTGPLTNGAKLGSYTHSHQQTLQCPYCWCCCLLVGITGGGGTQNFGRSLNLKYGAMLGSYSGIKRPSRSSTLPYSARPSNIDPDTAAGAVVLLLLLLPLLLLLLLYAAMAGPVATAVVQRM
jgi:hypothetical protein